MSGWRTLAARLLRGARVSPPLAEWVAAALAELPAIERTGAAIGWTLGIANMVFVDLLGQALFPWRRDPERRPPTHFVALLGLLLLAGPAWRAASGGAPAAAFGFLAALGVALSLWINLGVLIKAQSIDGYHHAVAIRLLPLNIAVGALAAALGAALL